MPMPKGYRAEHGYATNKSFEGGEDYRTIAEKLTSQGSKMNHATARNVFLSALCKIAKSVHVMHDLPVGDEHLRRTARDPRFQSGVAEILSSIRKVK